MSNGDAECALRACRLLQSNSSDSAELLRLYLDEAIKQKYSSNKTITSVLRKEILDEEQKICNVLSTGSSDNDIASHDDSMVEGLKNLLQDDLTCIVCRDMDVTAGNRLVECTGCHSLYHQECHKPHIPEQDVNDSEVHWYCSECKSEVVPVPHKSHKEKSKEGKSSDSHSSSKSPSSSSSLSKIYSSSSKSSSSKSESSNKSASSSPTVSSSSKVTPHIKILTPDKHAQNLKRKSSKQNDGKRKH